MNFERIPELDLIDTALLGFEVFAIISFNLNVYFIQIKGWISK